MAINFTIKTLEKGDHSCTMDPNKTVKELKDEMFTRIGVPVNQQRFIFCGQVMRDDAKLSEYGIADKAVHLVFSAPPLSPNAARERNEQSYNILSDDEEFDNQMFDVDDQVEVADWATPTERATESGRRLLLLEEMVYQCDSFVNLLRETCPRMDSDDDLLPTQEALNQSLFENFYRNFPAFGANQGEVKQMYELAEITRCIALLETKLYPFLMWYANYLDVDLEEVDNLPSNTHVTVSALQETLHMLAHIHHCHSEIILNENLRNHARPPREPSQSRPATSQPAQPSANTSASSDVVCQIETHTPVDVPTAANNDAGQPRRRRSRVQRTSIVVTRNGTNVQPPQLIQSLIQAVISRAHPLLRHQRPNTNRPSNAAETSPTAPNVSAASPAPATQQTSTTPAVHNATDISNAPVSMTIPVTPTITGATAAPVAPAGPVPYILMREIPYTEDGSNQGPAINFPLPHGETFNFAALNSMGSTSNAPTATQSEGENSNAPRRGPDGSSSRSSTNQPFNFRPRMLDRLFGSDNFNSDMRFGSHDQNLGEFCFDPYLNCNNRYRNSTSQLGRDRSVIVERSYGKEKVDDHMDLAAKTQAWRQYLRNAGADKIKCLIQDFSNPIEKLWSNLCATLTWMDMNQFFYGDVDIAMVRMRAALKGFILSEMTKHGIEAYTRDMTLEEKKAHYSQYVVKVFEEFSTKINDLKNTLMVKEGFDFSSALRFIMMEELPLAFIDILDYYCTEEDFAKNTVRRIKKMFQKIYWMLEVACDNPNDGVTKFSNYVKEVADSLSPNLYILFRTSQDKNNWIIEEATIKTEVKNASKASGSSSSGSQPGQSSSLSDKDVKNILNNEQKNVSYLKSSPQTTPSTTVLQNSANLSKLQINPVPSSEATRPTVSQPNSIQQKTAAPTGAIKSKFNTSFPEDWDPIVSEDAENNAISQISQGPFSDAYLSNIPSKKRKLVETKQVGNLMENLEQAARDVVPDLSRAALEGVLTNRELQGSLKATARAAIRQRLSSDPDYDPNRYQCSDKFFKPLE